MPVDATGGGSVLRATDPAGGAVVVRRDHVVYTPDDGFSGQDRFEVALSDGSTASVVVVVVPAAPAPVAVDDVASTTAGTPVLVGVLTNDRHVSSEARVSVVAGPGTGSATVGQDGAVTYRADDGSSGTDRFTYAVTTSSGVSEADVESSCAPPRPSRRWTTRC